MNQSTASGISRLPERLRWLFPTMRNVLIRRSLSTIDFGDVTSVLVVGAGDDPYRHLFPNSDAYVTSDVAARAGCTDVVADAVALPFGEGRFDCAVATEVLEYVPQPHLLVGELRRILRQGGTAVVTVPFVFQDHGDYSRLTARALGTLFQDYSSVRIFAQGNRFHTIIDLITTAFSPFPVLFPLRLLSNLLFLVPARFAARNTKSTAPSGFLVVARK